MITGQLNQHPRSAIAWLGGKQRDQYVEFYDKCISDI